MSKKKAGVFVLVLLVAIGIIWQLRGRIIQQVFAPAGSNLRPAVMTDADLSADVEIVAEGLEIPWEVAWLPDGSMLVTERPGRLSKIATSRQVIPIAGVEHVGEGGLLGLAVHPHFTQNHWIYLYLTTQSEGGLINRVERYQLVNSQLSDRKVVLDGIPGASFHDGGRLAFGPDGLLYITTGDAGQESNAQDPQSLAGKILRVGDDGSIPTGNPFANPVYSWGHRNPQGLAWDRAGRLWATEHGRSGIQSGLDEINMIMRGHNYGWPIIQGDEQQADMDKPVVHSGPRETWAPAGAAIWGDSLFFAGLRGESLYEAKLQDGRVEGVVAHFYQQFGRLRVVALGPDNYLYLATSNRDGRGSVQTGDDKIFRIKPASLPAGSLN